MGTFFSQNSLILTGSDFSFSAFCLVCRCEPWHAGVRCEQYQAERGDPEFDFAAVKATILKECDSPQPFAFAFAFSGSKLLAQAFGS